MKQTMNLTTAARAFLVCELLIGPPTKSEEAPHWTPLADEEELRAIFSNQSDLRDPFSIQFRDTQWQKKTAKDGSVTTVWCGQVNAKNAMGAYVGWKPFYTLSGLQEKPSVSVATGDFAKSTPWKLRSERALLGMWFHQFRFCRFRVWRAC